MTSFSIEKGLNLSHWLSQRQGWSPIDTFITKQDIVEIKGLGFDHVRLPIDEENLWDEELNRLQDNFTKMTDCIEWCIEIDLKIIIDVHIIRSHYFNAINEGGTIELWTSKEAQSNFLNLWIDLQDVLHNYPENILAYELMNEPVSDDHEDWNKLLKRTYEQIRETEENRTIIIGSNNWQNPETFPFLKLPPNAKNIILSCHMYEPLLFTHYKAYWLPIKNYTGKITYPGVPVSEVELNKIDSVALLQYKAMLDEKNIYFDKSILQATLQPAIDKAKALGFPLYCSEYGCLPSVDNEQRLQYYSDLIDVFKNNNISHCHWDYLGDFGIRSYNRVEYTKGELDSIRTQILLR